MVQGIIHKAAKSKLEVQAMPRFDGTGPQGDGPLTGGKRGKCTQGRNAASLNPGQGRGQGRGLGAGQGMQQGGGRGNKTGAGMPRGRGGNRG